jgi:tRNA(Ile2) C34 agmatinyltransferase TiaS
MSPSPKCPKCGALLNYDVTLGVYRCPQCRKIVCPFCVVVMDPYTFGRYKCPKCGYISSSPSGT